MIDTILNMIYFILILSVLIIIHELGHLMAAKKFGVYCKEFAIGMGPLVFQKQIGETAWSVRAFPIGGFVAMAGETLEDDGEGTEDVPFERTINGVKRWKQIVIMAAGAFMNIMLAWVVFIGITAYQGAVSVPGKPIVASVVENSPAQKAGLQKDDEITKVTNGKETVKPKVFDDVTEFVQYYPGATTFSILRDGKEMSITITPQYDKEKNMYFMGVGHNSDIKKINLIESIPYGTEKMVSAATSIFGALGKLVQGVGLNNLSGPVGIYNVTTQVVQDGFLSVLALIGLLSVNLGIVNLLPIPVLDGGRIFIILIETIIGKKLNERVQNAVMMLGVVILVGIMVFATWNDISRLL